MKTAGIYKKLLAGIMAAALTLFWGVGVNAVIVRAASGTVYTCTVNRCYAHPLTGEIEDSGGAASYATGQGMVEGAVYPTGIMEVTDSGEYYLTIRMSLMDYTQNHSFQVQNAGDSGWSTPAIGVTANGTDNNGTTSDICIQVPSENCVIRGSMYVQPMGRDVVFYLYPSDYAEGNSTDMVSTMVTAASGSGTETGQTVPEASALQSQALNEGTSSDSGSSSEESGKKLESTITEKAEPVDSTVSTEESTLNDAEGLSLSTAEEAEAGQGSDSIGSRILVNIVSITVSGLILLAVAAGIVYMFCRNWYRWGGGSSDDE